MSRVFVVQNQMKRSEDNSQLVPRYDFLQDELVALMLPYTLAFLVAWTILLVGWMALDIPLGETGPLHYSPPG